MATRSLSDRQGHALGNRAALLQVHFPFPAFGQEVLSEGFAEGIAPALSWILPAHITAPSPLTCFSP